MQSTDSRQAWLDWLRIMAIIGVLFFHSAMAYVAEDGWHLKNKETSHLLLEFNFWLSRFRMPLLFFISGAVSYYMLQKRSAGGFIGLRFRRLFIPLLFGILVVVPPQVYMERLTEGFHGNYWSFYPSIFTTGPYPKGNFSWHHLWFILYLFLYDIICAPLFTWLLSEKGKRLLQKMDGLAKGRRIYLIMLPAILLNVGLTLRFPETNDLIHDWERLPYWLFFLLAGFICTASPALTSSLERNRRTSFTVAFVSLICLNYLRWNQHEPWDYLPDWKHSWQEYPYLALYPVIAWFWVLTAIGYGKKYLNKPHRVLNYLNEAVYPFYILHQTIIIIVVYYLIQINETIGMKYVFTILFTFFLTMGIYHLFIRPFAVTRFLFGMKPKKPAAPPTEKEQKEAAPALQPA